MSKGNARIQWGEANMEEEKPRNGSGNGTQRKNLGQALIEAEFITPEQLDYASKLQQKQKKRLGEVLVEQKLITPEDLGMVQSIQLNVPFIDLGRHVVQLRALQLVPEDIARKQTLIPMDIVGDALVVVMADPDDVRTIDDLQVLCKMRVEPALGIPTDIRAAIDRSYRAGGEIQKQVSYFETPFPAKLDAPVTPEILARTPIVEILDLLVTQAVRDRASDVHIEPQEDRLRIRFRIDGVLSEAFSLPLNVHARLLSRIKIMAGMNIAEQRRPQDGQLSIKVADKSIDIRVATTETLYGERMTLRILDKSLALISLAELGLQSEALKKYRQMLKNPFGMILISGPTGSGKTTTLYASISQLDRSGLNIMTIEDPVEYRFLDINQVQVNPKAGLTFASGLRTIMRHDPDVILVGEIRDSETARVAIQAALTGHLVLSSIHANDAIGVFFRLMDLGIEPYLIAATLLGVVSQRIIRRICPHCQTLFQPPIEECIAYREETGEERTVFHTGPGCNNCASTGYLGRIGIFECLEVSEEVRRMLSVQPSPSEIRNQALREGMITMRHDGMLKAKAGTTTLYEVLRNVVSVN
ncbi:MAG: Flp pilus assembly complex ATPase component TadA [Chloroflexi bacterium]|nr:Flp pilus assembly complex ATPase component TadA [Chloroflexota bacterium]